MRIVTAAQMQAMDRRTIQEIGIPGQVLMENAGRGATRCFLERIYTAGPGRVGIMAGRGNNGGDGFVMARYLAQRGIEVTVFLLTTRDRVQGDAAGNLNLLPALKVPVVEIPEENAFFNQLARLNHINYWIDAIFGTGLNSDVSGYFKTVIDFINCTQRPVLAVDIPSGLNSDTGQPCGACIQASATVTFGFAKLGHLIHPGADLCGPVDVIDIGIPSTISAVSPSHALLTGKYIQSILPRRTANSHKGHTGHALVVAGSTGKTGAAAMAALSALRTGAGLVTLGIPRALNPILEGLAVEVMTLPLSDDGQGALKENAFDEIQKAMEGKRCLALGPGLGTAPHTSSLARRLIRSCPLPMVIDADGLNALAEDMSILAGRAAPTILSPHPGEMARLTQLSTVDIQKDRVSAARRLAAQSNVFVILKGARTVVAEPGGSVWINPTGNPGMASGGMGDVLTGAIAGLLAQGCPAADAAIAGVFLHGLAADILAEHTPVGYLATEVMAMLPLALERVKNDPPAPLMRGPLL
ncbi:MAG: NAD(P)H-hydrate dehydratase [Desulfobacteraceae bacterium]|nr:NAD(P)H-hydrate dehydratase [Desulfobacteraceae bacterium]